MEDTGMTWLKEQMIRYRVKGTCLLMALIAVYGIDYLGKVKEHFRPYYSVTNFFLLVGIYLLLQRTFKALAELEAGKKRRKRILYSAILSFLFAVSVIVGYQLQNFGMTEAGFKGKTLILVRAVALGISVFPFGNMFFSWIEGEGKPVRTGRGKEWKTGVLFCASAILIFACLVPVWLAYYPIIMSYDFHRQVNEAYKGFIWFYPYQPIAHTWMIWLFMQLGSMLGSYQTGMACMAVFQMLLFAVVAAYGTVIVYRLTRRKAAAVVTALFLAVFPYNSVLMVCTTKDAIFSILFMLFFLMLIEHNRFSEGRKKYVMEILMILEGSLMMQFRSNAIYAVALFMVVAFLLSARKEKLRMLLFGVLLILGAKGTQYAIRAAIGTELEAPSVEAYSVPIQQFARVGYYHGSELAETEPETAALINRYVPWEYWSDYNPPISDTVKVNVDGKNFSEHKLQFLKDWLWIGGKFPNEFLDAFLELTRGYWFWDDYSWAECLGYGEDSEFGVLYTYTSSEIAGYGSIEQDSKFPWLQQQLHKIVNANCFYDWPVISIVFRSSFYTWALFLVLISLLYKRQKEAFILAMFPAIYIFSMFFGPVVQIRYLLPIMVTLPMVVAIFFDKKFKES